MIKIMFVCHGNICRSPLAEFLFKKLISDKDLSDKFIIESSGTSTEELGNGVYPPVLNILRNLGIDASSKRASVLKLEDYYKYDFFIGMDSENIRNINRILNHNDKTNKLLNFAGINLDVADPWYTRDFTKTYEDVFLGLNALFSYLETLLK